MHNFDYDLICNRLTWISYSQIQHEKSKKKKKKYHCWWSYCTVSILTAARFSFIFISAQTHGFWEALAPHTYVDPETTQTQPVRSEFLHTDERLSLMACVCGPCVTPERWAHPHTGNTDDVLTLTAGRRPYGLHDALIESHSAVWRLVGGVIPGLGSGCGPDAKTASQHERLL